MKSGGGGRGGRGREETTRRDGEMSRGRRVAFKEESISGLFVNLTIWFVPLSTPIC